MGTVLTSAPNISQMMQKAIAERLPIVALCHGPTLLAATAVIVGGKPEALNKGIATASLPPFEGYVGFTGRKEIQFTYDVNTHRALEFVGGKTDVKRDIANMGRVVQEERTLDGGSIDIITGVLTGHGHAGVRHDERSRAAVPSAPLRFEASAG